MPQSTKEWVLNYTVNRWGLNKKRRLGPTSDSIRICQPETKELRHLIWGMPGSRD